MIGVTSSTKSHISFTARAAAFVSEVREPGCPFRDLVGKCNNWTLSYRLCDNDLWDWLDRVCHCNFAELFD
jgi:hypothetical protein